MDNNLPLFHTRIDYFSVNIMYWVKIFVCSMYFFISIICTCLNCLLPFLFLRFHESWGMLITMSARQINYSFLPFNCCDKECIHLPIIRKLPSSIIRTFSLLLRYSSMYSLLRRAKGLTHPFEYKHFYNIKWMVNVQ